MTTKDFNLKTIPPCSMWVPSLLSTIYEAAKPLCTHRCRAHRFEHDLMSSTWCEIILVRELTVVTDPMFDLMLNSKSNPYFASCWHQPQHQLLAITCRPQPTMHREISLDDHCMPSLVNLDLPCTMTSTLTLMSMHTTDRVCNPSLTNSYWLHQQGCSTRWLASILNKF